jgi:hypothetical protein
MPSLIREIILAKLGIRCVFPSTLEDQHKLCVSARCMLEDAPLTSKMGSRHSFDEFIEDVIVKVRRLRDNLNDAEV